VAATWPSHGLPRGSRQMPSEGACQNLNFGLDSPSAKSGVSPNPPNLEGTKFGRMLGNMPKREANGFDPVTSSKPTP
jgi:hypothetical protein